MNAIYFVTCIETGKTKSYADSKEAEKDIAILKEFGYSTHIEKNTNTITQ